MLIEEKKVWIKGLLVKCPFDIPLSSCPISEIRELPPRRRINYVNDLPEDELDIMLDHHRECQRLRRGMT